MGLKGIVSPFVSMEKKIERLRVIGYIVIIVVIIVTAWFVSQNFFQIMLIQGDSMEPAYHNLQFVILDKSFDAEDIAKGDVVAFRCEGLNAVLVKRVVAVKGDKAVIRGKHLYVNGELSDYYHENFFEYAGKLEQEIVLGNREFMVIGDNIEKSKDSRYLEVGVVRYEDIIGIVID